MRFRLGLPVVFLTAACSPDPAPSPEVVAGSEAEGNVTLQSEFAVGAAPPDWHAARETAAQACIALGYGGAEQEGQKIPKCALPENTGFVSSRGRAWSIAAPQRRRTDANSPPVSFRRIR